MSIFKTNKFFRVIKHFILCLPLMFVIGTSLYSIVNPNAKDSYYGDTINEKQIVKYNKLENGLNYQFHNADYFTFEATIQNTSLFPLDNTIIYNGNTLTNVSYMSWWGSSANNSMYFALYYNDGTSTSYLNLITSQITIEFTLDSYSRPSSSVITQYLDCLYIIEYNQYSYLNNAFEYGLYQFTQIGFGQFDFISLFNGIFTTHINNVYASFINDYINYYLFVEMVYFTPWVIHTFIHFAYDLGEYFTSSFKRNKKEDD